MPTEVYLLELLPVGGDQEEGVYECGSVSIVVCSRDMDHQGTVWGV